MATRLVAPQHLLVTATAALAWLQMAASLRAAPEPYHDTPSSGASDVNVRRGSRLPHAQLLGLEDAAGLEDAVGRVDAGVEDGLDRLPLPPGFAPALPDHVSGHTIILAGDSNDRQFVKQICSWYQAELTRIPEIFIGDKNPFNATSLIFPTMSQASYCYVKKKDLMFMNLVHFGLLHKEKWYHKFMRRNEDVRLPEAPWKTLGYRRRIWAEPGEYARLIWPRLIENASHGFPGNTSRPTILMVQSSLWDLVPFLEMSEPKPANLSALQLQRRYHDMMWCRKAGQFVDSVKHSGIKTKSLLWRTTPGCPVNNTPLTAMLELQAQEATKAIHEAHNGLSTLEGNALEEAQHWKGVKLLDWAKEYPVKDKDQCQESHFPANGYKVLLQALLNMTK